MKNNRTFAQEAKAMEFTIQKMYEEKTYLEQRIKDYNNEKDRGRLQMVNHFISIYERY